MKAKRDSNVLSLSEAREAETIRFNREHYGKVIREHRIALGMTQVQLAEAVDVPKNNVTHWEAGRTRPDLNIVPLVCETLKIDLATFFGVNEHFEALNSADRDILRKIQALPEHDRRVLQATINGMLEIARQDQWAFCRDFYMPVMRNEQSAAAGVGETLQAPSQQLVFVRRNPLAKRADEIVRVNGQSMEPDFHHGQEVYVQHTNEIQIGEIGLFVVNGEGFIKQLAHKRLHSLNPDYPDIQLNETDDVRCVGKVIGTVDENDLATREQMIILQELFDAGEFSRKD